MKILAIDDNQDNLITLKALIKESFSDSFVFTALDGPTGLLLASSEDPDVILLDILMPGMDGFEVCRKLKADSITSDIPVVFVTAIKGDKESRIKALESGAEAFLAKPIDESELTAQIRAMVKIKTANKASRDEKKRLSILVEEQLHEINNTYTATLNLLEDLSRENEARKKSEYALQESEQNYRTIVESGQALIWTSDVNKKNTYSNSIWLAFTGRKQEQEIGSGWTENVHPDDLKRYLDFFEQSTDKKIKYSIEYRLRRYDGEYRWIQEDGCPRYDINGVFIGYIGHCLDINERKEAEKKVNALLAEKELILKEVHHRIKNNMSTIYGFLVLQAATLKDSSAISSLEDAANRVRSMMLLYDKLYKSADFNEISIALYLPSLIDEIVANFPNALSITVKKNIEDIILNAKKMHLLGVILNELLTNIMKYAFVGRSEGLIMISATLKETQVQLVIEDNGNGMPTSVDFEDSTGFGLILVDGLTKQLEGNIRIERNNGTKIILEFNK